jgi:TM2 domain-containing membrane protein YozV
MILKKDFSTVEITILADEMQKKQKNKVSMYLMWWFFGVFGGHRFYLGDSGKGTGLLLTLGGFGIWAIMDLFFIGKRLEVINNKIELEIIQQILMMRK